jgi:hypothetical protein
MRKIIKTSLLPSASEILERLKEGREVSDKEFDGLFPQFDSRLSEMHWTPLKVALRAATLLVQEPGARILDVGSGIGKFCFVGALTTEGKFTGVELRENLLLTAQNFLRTLRISGVSFQLRSALELDWSPFDGFYFYNPFYEALVSPDYKLDESIKSSKGSFRRSVLFVENQLRIAKRGTRVATFHGFGGEFPLGYEILIREELCGGKLEVWEKTS